MSSKKYIYKVYSIQGDFIKTLDLNKISEDFGYTRNVDSGYGNISFVYYHTHNELVPPIGAYQVLYVTYENQVLYKGYLADYEKDIDSKGEYWRFSVIGMQALLNNLPYTYSGEVEFSRSAEASVIIKEIITHYNTTVGYDLFDPDTIDSTGLDVNLEFSNDNCITAIKHVIKNIGYIIDFKPDGSILLKKPDTTQIDHALVYGRHISAISQKYKTSEMCNKVTLHYGENSLTDTNDDSVDKYGLIRKIIKDDRIKNSDTAELRVQSELEKGADPINQIDIRVVDTYDIESLNIGDTVAIKNYKGIRYGMTRGEAEELGYTLEDFGLLDPVESDYVVIEPAYHYITKIDYKRTYVILSLGDYESLSKSLNTLQ